MDNLQHIDDLLKRAALEPANALVNDSDWNAIERKLKQQRNRVYAMWFFVAFVVVSSVTTALLIPSKNININTPPITNSTQGSDNKLEDKLEINHLENELYEGINKLKTSKRQNKEAITSRMNSSSITNYGVTGVEPVTKPNQENNTIKLETISHNLNKKSLSRLSNMAIEYREVKFKPLDLIKNIQGHINHDVGSSSNKTHFEIGFVFTPIISNKVIKQNNTLSGLINRNYFNFIADNEKASFSNSYGINLQYHNKSPFFIGTGLFIAQRAEIVDYDYTITEYPVSQNGRSIDDYAQLMPVNYIKIDYTGSNSYHFIEIPLNIGYKQPISSNFEIRSQVGVSYLGLLSTAGKKGDSYDLELKDLSDLNFNTTNIGLNARTGLFYNTPKFTFGVEPTYSQNLNSLTDLSSASIEMRPYHYGLNISTNIKLYRK